MDFYVYIHRRKTDNSVFYVGKGCGRRAWSSYRRNRHWHNIVEKNGFYVEVIKNGMQEWWAFELEIELIAYYGRINLCNVTDGGEGASGYRHTDESRKKISDNTAARSESVSKKKSEKLKGRTFSEQHRNNLSVAQTGKPLSQKRRNQMKSENPMSRPEIVAKMKLSKSIPVRCSNGMIFKGARIAESWLKENGWPKAVSSNIGLCAKGRCKQAYGFTWAYV